MKMKLFTFMSVLLLQAPMAHAYRMIIFTDEAKPEKALKVIEEFRSTYPFNKFEIEFQVARAKPEQLNCKSSPKAERLITCTNSIKDINIITQKMGGDQALVIKDLDIHAGSAHVGHGTPVMTTGAAKNTMLHEYLHTLGLCDEYVYERELADDYCYEGATTAMNKAFITPLPSYQGDSDARSKHSKKIKWFSHILASTPITNSNGRRLGTGTPSTTLAPQNNTFLETAIDMPTGLYPSGVCMNSTNGVKTWKPSGTETMMESLNAGLGKPLERIVEQMLLAKGMKLKPQYRNAANAERSSTVVEDSGRGIFKQIFGAPQAPKQDSRGVSK